MTLDPHGEDRPGPPSRLAAAKAMLSQPVLLVGVAGACALGLTLGLIARPQLAEDTRVPGSMKPVAQVQVEIDRDEPLPPVQGGRLELSDPGVTAPSAPAPPAAAPAPARPRSTPAPAPARGPSFDCARAASPAEGLVCDDPGLSALDRRLAAVWGRALEAGVPDWRLRRRQMRWLDAREEAAQEAPEAVADLYEQRIQELEDEVALAADSLSEGRRPGLR